MKPLATSAISMALGIASLSLAHCAGTPLKPALAGSARCSTCHEEEARFCQYGAHRSVECEECHGPGAEHAGAETGPRPPMRLGDVDLCMSCHAQGAGASSTISSFEDHLRDLERDHRIKLDRRKSGTDCVYCHDPHLLE